MKRLDLDKKRIIELYKKGNSCIQIGKIFNVTHTTISKILKANNIEVIVNPGKYNFLDEDLIIKLYKEGMSLGKIAETFKVSRKPITRIIKSNNIEITTTNNKLYSYDVNFFKKIDNEEKAYWLGFLYADGNVYSKNYKKNNQGKHVIDISLSIIDIEHLKKFKKAIKTNAPVSIRETRCNNKIFKACRFSINNKEMTEDIIKLGCVPNKSLILDFPNENIVPNNLLRHFIRGYFDGDGSVYWNSSKNTNTICFNILGTKMFLNGISDYFYNNINDYTNTSLYKKDKGNCMFILKSGKQVINTLDFLYNNSTIYLDRKYEKYLELKQKFNCRHKTNPIEVL